jgi:hypothetical protein
MTDIHTPFLNAASTAFAFLAKDHGFIGPELERIGREAFVRFHRGAQTVSISAEAGATPFVTIFAPTLETGAASVPWAAKGGIDRSLRSPHLAQQALAADPRPGALEQYLLALAGRFKEVEHEWLAR